MKFGQNIQNGHRREPEALSETLGDCLGLIPFLNSDLPISSFFGIFHDYLITARAVGHDIFSPSDIRNESEQPETEIRSSLPSSY